MSEAVQLLIYGSLLSAVGAVWTVLNAKINKLADEVEKLRAANEALRTTNSQLEDVVKDTQVRADRYEYFYTWYRKAYRDLGGTGSPPPMEEIVQEGRAP